MVQDGLKAVVERIRGAGERRVVVLASGDPLFYGIGAYLARQLGPETLSVIPHVSSVQLAFARCGESWQDAAVVSVHGRPLRGLAQRVNACDKVALLTDDVNTPAVIANYLLSFGMAEYRAFVGEPGRPRRADRLVLACRAGRRQLCAAQRQHRSGIRPTGRRGQRLASMTKRSCSANLTVA